MEFVKYYPDERDLGPTDKPFEFGLGKESGGEVTEAWFARNEAGIMSVFYRSDRKMVDIMFSSPTRGYRHVQAYDVWFRVTWGGYIPIVNESGIFKGREDTKDMSVLKEYRVGGLPAHIQGLFDRALLISSSYPHI